jgi:hypothetical protein
VSRYFECDECTRWYKSEDDIGILHFYEYRQDITPPGWVPVQKAVCRPCIEERVYDPVRGTSGIHPDQSEFGQD